MKSVLIGVSGGIDSTFSAIYLSEKGYKVIAINLVLTSKNTVSKEVIDLFKKYDIDFYTLDTKDYFKKTVIDRFINDYKNGF
ncbi:7-cyano-7-deazaguanine synthase, partial [Desulfurella sp.]|uniref:7-cyano-7-deazaguanine synthase n=1 Tax=Desulfurella sp. TaxID=1962857 RepID=UPI0025C0C7A8